MKVKAERRKAKTEAKNGGAFGTTRYITPLASLSTSPSRLGSASEPTNTSPACWGMYHTTRVLQKKACRPVFSGCLRQSLSILHETAALVLDDANVDCVAITFYGGSGFDTSYSGDVWPVDAASLKGSEHMDLWNEPVRDGGDVTPARSTGLPAHFDLETAIKALGTAAYYSKVKSSLYHKAP